MARSQKEPLRAVTAEERAALERLSRASSARVDRVRRATALLAVADGRSFAAAARQAGLRSGPGVAGVVRRFNQRGLGAVAIAPGRGRRATYGTAERKRKAGVVRVVDPRTEEKTVAAEATSRSGHSGVTPIRSWAAYCRPRRSSMPVVPRLEKRG